MGYVYLVPYWFFGFDIAMQLLFAIITAVVAFYAFKTYNLGQQREIRLFGFGFFFISFAYVVKAISTLFILRNIQQDFLTLSLQNLNRIEIIGLSIYVFFFLAGLVTIAYTTFRVKSLRVYSLLLATNIIVMMTSADKAMAFNFLSTILLFYISVHYAMEYYKNRNSRILFVLSAFFLLLLSNLELLFANGFYGNYIISHVAELISYSLILTSLALAIKKR